MRSSHSAAVFIQRLPFSVTESELIDIYSEYGSVKSISIKRFNQHLDATAKISYEDDPMSIESAAEIVRKAIIGTDGRQLLERNRKYVVVSRYGDKKIKLMAKKKR